MTEQSLKLFKGTQQNLMFNKMKFKMPSIQKKFAGMQTRKKILTMFMTNRKLNQ